jgi:hypothetical protein
VITAKYGKVTTQETQKEKPETGNVIIIKKIVAIIGKRVNAKNDLQMLSLTFFIVLKKIVVDERVRPNNILMLIPYIIPVTLKCKLLLAAG